MKYKCLETFSLPEYPEYDDGVETEREITVPAGSIWKGEKPVREIEQEVVLTHKNGWRLDIARELLDLMLSLIHI